MPVEENLRTLSYARGPDRPLLELTIGGLLHRTASGFPIAWRWLHAISRSG
jgi:hypothetical protein